MIEWLQAQMTHNGSFSWWAIVGWLGNAVFFTRFFVQWYVTEKKKQVIVPMAFWWLSLGGSLLLLIYAIFGLHSKVIIFSYAFNWIPYLRNIIIHKRHQDSQKTCSNCKSLSAPSANYCPVCGTALATTSIR